MDQSLTVHPASPLLDHCPPTLSSQWYLDPAIFRREQKEIWARNWIYACRDAEIGVMTVKRVAIAGEPLILVRDGEGQLRAFHNVCRHRGAELCAASENRLASRLLVCPYHRWSYDLSGRLVRTPYVSMTGDFKPEDHALFPVAVTVWNGFVFLCLAEDPPPFDRAPDLGVGALDAWPMGDLVTGHVLTKTIACNWKIFWENYNECLHCPGIHPELCATVPVYARGYMAPNEAPDWDPQSPAPSRTLREGVESWTVDGKPCGPVFPTLTPTQRDEGHRFVTLLPSLFIVAHVDYVRAVSLRPIGPDQTELRAEWLFMPETLAAPDFDLDNVTAFATTVLMQDAAACEMNQRGLASSRYRHGTLMPQEFDVHRFQQWVRHQMAGGPT